MPERPDPQTVIDAAADLPTSVWLTGQRSAPVQRRGRYLSASSQHPAKMQPDTAAHAITVYTTAGDLVADPMCGIGTSLVEAVYQGRDAVGVELEGRWADLAAGNIALARSQGATGAGMVVRGDATGLVELLPAAMRGTAALVVTSPPYGPSVHGLVRPGPGGIEKSAYRYSEVGRDRHNLAHAGWSGLVEGMTRIFAGCRLLLRPGGILAVTARPVRRHETLVDLPSAVVTAGVAAGLTPVERCVALLAGWRDGRLVARPSFFQLQQIRNARRSGVPLHLIAHEDVLVLRSDRKSASSREPKRSQENSSGNHRNHRMEALGFTQKPRGVSDGDQPQRPRVRFTPDRAGPNPLRVSCRLGHARGVTRRSRTGRPRRG